MKLYYELPVRNPCYFPVMFSDAVFWEPLSALFRKHTHVVPSLLGDAGRLRNVASEGTLETGFPSDFRGFVVS